MEQLQQQSAWLYGSLVLGATVALLGYYLAAAKQRASPGKNCSGADQTSSKTNVADADEKEQGKQREVSKRQAKSKKRREIQQEFTHSWMVGALKGHTAPILDMDFSANGKFLASCAEDRAEQQRGRHQLEKGVATNNCSSKSPSSSGLSPDKPKSPPSTPPSPTSSTKSSCSHDSESSSSSPLSTQLQRVGLSRRQRKNRTARAPREQRKQLRERDEDHEDDHNGPPPSSASSPTMDLVSPVKGSSGRSRRGQASTPAKQQQKQQKSPASVGKTISGNGSKMSRAQKMSASGASLLRRKLNQLSDAEIALMLRQYVLTADELVYLGYPVCFWDSPEHVMIYSNRHGPSSNAVNYHHHHHHHHNNKQQQQQQHNLDANAREFVPAGSPSSSTSCSGSEADSGNGTSASSSDQDEQESSCSSSGSDSDKASDCGQVDEQPSTQPEPEPELPQQQQEQQRKPANALERRCARCSKSFYARRSDGEYISEDKCLYHWGKLRRAHDGESYECCRGRTSNGGSSCSPSKGCTVGRVHVWTGIVPGTNGPLHGYVRTRPAKYVACDGNYGVYALDCEMCFTKNGLELGKVTVVALDGKLIYEAFCKPEAEIIDYNTRFSGLRAKDLVNASKRLKDVQKDLLSFVSAETLLIGHGLENDLRALKIIHTQVVDTSFSYPHFKGFPFKYSLKALARTILNRDIQQLEHDSAEDARIAAELMLKKLQIDFFT